MTFQDVETHVTLYVYDSGTWRKWSFFSLQFDNSNNDLSLLSSLVLWSKVLHFVAPFFPFYSIARDRQTRRPFVFMRQVLYNLHISHSPVVICCCPPTLPNPSIHLFTPLVIYIFRLEANWTNSHNLQISYAILGHPSLSLFQRNFIITIIIWIWCSLSIQNLLLNQLYFKHQNPFNTSSSTHKPAFNLEGKIIHEICLLLTNPK